MPSNRSHLEEMKSAFAAYDAEALDFPALIGQLGKHFRQMDNEDSAWTEAFQREWETLETAYAYASFKGLRTIPESRMHDVESSLSALRRMIAEKLQT